MFKRNIQKKLEKGLLQSPIVLITGARQTGKTTLVKQISKEKEYTYITFDDLRFLSAVQHDPIGFIGGLKKPVILDEVQRVPEVFLPIKQDVDENRNPGRYILTGSANPLLIPRLGDSLAGRMEIFNLFPFSQGELIGIKDEFIDMVFNKELPSSSEVLSRENLYKKIGIGGYPTVQTSDYEGRESWFNSYITALLQRDVKDLANISGLAEFPILLQLLATRAANLFNAAELSRTIGIPTTTLHRYLSLLETLFMIYFQRPWSFNRGKRLVKSPKLYLVDSGLLTFLLGMNLEQEREDIRAMGPLLENFVINELCKQATWNQTRVQLYHYRTSTGIEVDLVLEDAAGNIVGIEIKNSETVTAHDFNGLKYLQETIDTKFVQGIILYTGSITVPFAKNLHALPINALWTPRKKV